MKYCLCFEKLQLVDVTLKDTTSVTVRVVEDAIVHIQNITLPTTQSFSSLFDPYMIAPGHHTARLNIHACPEIFRYPPGIRTLYISWLGTPGIVLR